MTDTPVGPVAEAVEAAEAAEAVEAAAAEPPARAAVWTVHAAPIGPLLLVATREGLAHVVFHAEGRTVGRALARAAAVLGAPPLPWEPPAAEADGARHLRTAVAELERYFAGAREPFSVPLDWSLTGGFHERVLRELAAGVPYGHTVGSRIWPSGWASRVPPGPSGSPWAPIRCPSSCPATGCWRARARWAGSGAAAAPSRRC